MALGNSKLLHILNLWLLILPRIPIEHRPPLEACLVRGALYPSREEMEQAIVMITPPDLKEIYNPSFDVTPAELISAIVTENGVATKGVGETVFDLSGVV
jgi:Predicted translation initiation factor 2B subunit, eIF-2B alpha/beta/delta family